MLTYRLTWMVLAWKHRGLHAPDWFLTRVRTVFLADAFVFPVFKFIWIACLVGIAPMPLLGWANHVSLVMVMKDIMEWLMVVPVIVLGGMFLCHTSKMLTKGDAVFHRSFNDVFVKMTCHERLDFLQHVYKGPNQSSSAKEKPRSCMP